MENENRNAYSEVIEILKTVEREKRLEALPMEMLELLKSKANPEYKPVISTEIPLDEQNLQPETLSILSWIALKCWNDEIEKETISENHIEENAESNLSQNKDLNNLSQINTQSDSSQNNNQSNLSQANIQSDLQQNNGSTENYSSALPALYKDMKWYQKIKIKIIEFFNKIFGKRKERGELQQ